MAPTQADTVVDRTRRCLEIAILEVATPIMMDTNARIAPPWPLMSNQPNQAGASNVSPARPSRGEACNGGGWGGLDIHKF